jgi:hypothetical protein
MRKTKTKTSRHDPFGEAQGAAREARAESGGNAPRQPGLFTTEGTENTVGRGNVDPGTRARGETRGAGG